MIHIVEWRALYHPSHSPVYLSQYSQTPCSILLLKDCCKTTVLQPVLSMLHHCIPSFQEIHIIDMDDQTYKVQTQKLLRSNPNKNWIVVLTYDDTKEFIKEEQNWHAMNRNETNQSS